MLKRGKTLHVESIRLVSLSRVHGAALKYTVSSLDFDGELEIRSSVVKNTPINGKITTKTVNEKAEGKAFLLETRTKRTCMDVAAAVLHTVIAAEYTDEVINSENTYTYTIRAALKPGNAVSLEKYASFYSAADGADNLAESAMRGAEKNAADGFGTLRSEQAAAWANHWKTGDILIKGSKADQQAVRFSLFSPQKSASDGEQCLNRRNGADRSELQRKGFLGYRNVSHALLPFHRARALQRTYPLQD